MPRENLVVVKGAIPYTVVLKLYTENMLLFWHLLNQMTATDLLSIFVPFEVYAFEHIFSL